MKRCCKCDEEKDERLFGRNASTNDGRAKECLVCRRKNYKKNRSTGKRAKAKQYRDRKFRKYWPDLTPRQALDTYNGLIASQGNKCPICSELLIKGPLTHIDHCHTTSIVRGILCQSCNIGLGAFKDSPDALDRAAQYLRGVVGKIQP